MLSVLGYYGYGSREHVCACPLLHACARFSQARPWERRTRDARSRPHRSLPPRGRTAEPARRVRGSRWPRVLAHCWVRGASLGSVDTPFPLLSGDAEQDFTGPSSSWVASFVSVCSSLPPFLLGCLSLLERLAGTFSVFHTPGLCGWRWSANFFSHSVAGLPVAGR